MSTPITIRQAPRLHVGQAVHVNAYAAWHPATVTWVAHTRIGIAFHGVELPASYADAVAPHVVRPADGIRLQQVSALGPGDQVVAFDDTRLTVANVWRGRDRWWVISYTNGEYATVPPARCCGWPNRPRCRAYDHIGRDAFRAGRRLPRYRNSIGPRPERAQPRIAECR